MSDSRRNKQQSTGTVPKSKCRKNTSYPTERDSPRSWTNNNLNDCQRLNLSDLLRSSRRNTTHPNYCTMGSIDDQIRHINVNGTVTPNTSSSTSRRNSSGTVPKCDNITKCPDKKQIEDKLSQIREYLQITTSLMASMKNSDDQAEKENLTQMIRDLKDSEDKLINILDDYQTLDDNGDAQPMENGDLSESSTLNRNEIDEKLDHRNREIEQLKDQQLSLLSLQQKAENKLKDARQIQEKLLRTNDLNMKDKNLSSLEDFDLAIKELEERTKRIKEPTMVRSNVQPQDKLLTDVDSLHNQIINLHNVNDERGQLLHILDNRDIDLKLQHSELQTKLNDLQNRKQQIDQLVMQLQTCDNEDIEDDDVAGQVKKIVTMKEQLSKLKDMLEIVKTTEVQQRQQELPCDVCTKTDNYQQNTNNKKINKNKHEQQQQCFGGAKPKLQINNKEQLQAELEAKKRELEAIMGKHKMCTSNLNNDVIGNNDNKSEFSSISGNNGFFDGMGQWGPTGNNRPTSSNQYSSHDCSEEDANEYSALNTPQQQKRSYSVSSRNSEKSHSHDYIHQQHISRTPECNNRSLPIHHEHASDKVQKQLELIRSLCDSMLEQQQQQQQQQQQNVQLRNNLTPSPLYLEPRQQFSSSSPIANSLNTINVVNPMEMPFLNNTNSNNNGIIDNSNWLTTNTLQTQAFMLNTLNQCCQMLWLQQKELLGLRQTVNQLQERLGESSQYVNNNNLASPLQPSNPVESNQYRTQNHNQNHQVSTAYSMPNLNEYTSTNIQQQQHSSLCPAASALAANNQNNIQNARILDQLNNINLNQTNNNNSNNDNINNQNGVLHGINNSINHQLWNGQALNNQVPPGNRANNYWDNFRSYSRQNLLSSKSNEGCHHQQQMERSNITLSTTNNNPFTLMSLPNKSNSHETRRQHFPTINRNLTAIPPDVLNISKQIDVTTNRNNENDQFYLNNNNNENSSNTSLISEELIFKDCIPEVTRRRNEWHDNTEEEQMPQKSKLFEELRENVYKEVANLLSANEARPHFLIQLFRDLQMISSDPLRLKILQSIQTVITHSTINNTNPQQQQQQQQQMNEQELNQMVNDCFSLQSTVWTKKNTIVNNWNLSEEEIVVKEILPFLNDNEDEIIQQQFLIVVKQMLIDSQAFQDMVKDTVFQKHFSNVLDEVLAQYLGKKVREVKMHIIQTIGDLLRGELSFIQLIQDTCPENCESDDKTIIVQDTNNIQNGDLAEADQGRDDDIEEEGAVGGFWGELTPITQETLQINTEEIDLSNIDIQNNIEVQTQFIKQGLDQVPTRLPTKSRSNTPNKDRSCSRSDHQDQF